EQSINLVDTYELISCLTFEALKAKIDPFNPIVHKQKPHPDQLSTAEMIWRTLSDSKMISKESTTEKQLQSYEASSPIATNYPIEDAYSIRCTPHILGPIKASLSWIKSVVTNEINSSNDNPLVIPGHPEAFHNGHFHGQYISMAMDHLSIALTTLSNLSDRRIDRLMDKNNSNGLPPFLCKETPGLRLGLMGGQFMAASLTSENRSLCNPVSIQSLTSTGDFQDIVSLGLVAARRAQEIYTNAAYVLSFELLCGAQAAEIRGSHLLSSRTSTLFKNTRKIVPYLSTDQCLTNYLEGIAQSIKTNEISMNQTKENATDLDARYYAKHSSLQKGLAKNILEGFQISPQAHILDVGCGDGRITAELASRAQEGLVIGVDASPSMVDFASRNFPPPEHPNLRFQLGMAEEVKFTEKFDLIVSFSCFHWLKNPEKAFRRMSAALKPGGEMLILTYPKESHYYSYLETALKKHPEYAALAASKTMLPIKGYKKLLLKNRFEIIDFQQHDLSADYNTPEEIQEYIKGWLNSYVPLPEHLYKSFLEDVCHAVLGDPTTRKGKKICMPYTALVIRARKIAE
ncbi:MAG TPA: aromatic amino acid lyase, partial [Rhabdochlamydiaceae bacterium]